MKRAVKENITLAIIIITLVCIIGLIIFNFVISTKKPKNNSQLTESTDSKNTITDSVLTDNNKCEFPKDSISEKYASVNCFKNGLSLFEMKVEDTTGLTEGVDYFTDMTNEHYYHGYIDENGKRISNKRFEFAEDFSEGLGLVSFGKDDKYYYIQRDGKLLNQEGYKSAKSFSEGLASVCNSNDCGYIDKTGKMVIQQKYRDSSSFQEGLASVMITHNGDELYGYIDKQDSFVLKPQFINANKFSEGLASVQLETFKGYGYINKAGTLVIPAQYKTALDFKNDRAIVSVENSQELEFYGVINKSGEIVIPTKYIEMSEFNNGYSIAVLENGKHGLIDENGKIILPFEYDDMTHYSYDNEVEVEIYTEDDFVTKTIKLK